jgi:hypothetical protein
MTLKLILKDPNLIAFRLNRRALARLFYFRAQ